MLLGYIFTTVYSIALIGLLSALFIARKDIAAAIRKGIDRYAIMLLIAVLAFFVVFELLFVHPVEQLYFDENIYQGIALNILMHGNASWCLYGTSYAHECMLNAIYHDPAEDSFFIAISFALFGIGIGTAYGLQLLMGALSIVFVFLLASALFENKWLTACSAFIFALMPELFIWSRTEAVPDLPFMALATFAFFSFVVFIKSRDLRSLYLFGFALLTAFYMRIEGSFLILIFAASYFVLGNGGLKKTIRERKMELVNALNNSTELLTALLFFVLLSIPEFYYIALQASAPNYGQGYTSLKIFSLYNFFLNMRPNVAYLFGLLNKIEYYPVAFPAPAPALAIIGVAGLLLDKGQPYRKGIAIMLGLWFIAYFLFYAFFYAGAVNSGVDVRFMLIILPPVSIFAARGIYEIATLANTWHGSAKASTGKKPATRVSKIIFAALLIALVILPFVFLVPIVTIPVSSMPQQYVPNAAVSFIYQNFNKVPADCLVYTFTPDIWYELGRNAASIQSYMPGSRQTEGYSCYVFDYGYWCIVPPFHSTVCAQLIDSYKTVPLATSSIYAVPYGNVTYGLYELLNTVSGKSQTLQRWDESGPQ